MDVLSDVFETVQVRGTLYFRTDFSHPWGTTVPRLGRATRFHYVMSGECWIRVNDHAPVKLDEGDFILVPGGASHVLSSAPDHAAPPLEDILRMAKYNGDRSVVLTGEKPSAATRLICGHFNFADGADHPLLRALPDHVILRKEARLARPWLNEVINLLVTNVFRTPDAPIAVITRLSEIVLIETLRSAGDEAPEVRQLVEGFADPRIGRALAIIHREWDRDWTVEALAREAGMSRTRFATRFHALLGTTPIAYLSDWRLQRAASLLATTNRTVVEIARLSGYTSAASFARAFRHRYGATPKNWRRQSGID